MASPDLPSPETLRKLLRYEPETGKLFWRPRPLDTFATTGAGKSWNTKWSDNEAFTASNSDGYKHGAVFGTIYAAHRVIWAIDSGAWPSIGIDHIDGDRSNNRILNLRSASQSENCQNRARRSDNSSGVTGVTWHHTSCKWRAQIFIDGKYIHLGAFNEFDMAVNVRKCAEIIYGFHVNHGRDPIY